MAEINGKNGALLGGLIVFIIPLLIVSAIYLSKKPDIYELPIVEETPFVLKNYKTAFSDTVKFSALDQDIKLLYKFDSISFTQKKSELKTYLQKAKNYPNPTFKDRYPRIIFFGINQDSTAITENLEEFDWYSIHSSDMNSELLNRIDDNKLYMIDRLGYLRATYTFNDFDQLEVDLNNLMVETYHKNNKAKRRKQF